MKEGEDRVVSTEWGRLKAIKLKEDMAARLKEEGELVKECNRVVDMAANFDHYEVLCRLAKNRAQVNKEQARSIEGQAKVFEDWAKAIKEKATSIATWVVEEYKDSDAFMVDAIVAAVGIDIIVFDDCKAKVTEAYLDVNLHHITLADSEEEEEEEEDKSFKEGEVAKEPTAKEGGIDRGVVEAPTLMTMAVEVPKEVATPIKVPKESTGCFRGLGLRRSLSIFISSLMHFLART